MQINTLNNQERLSKRETSCLLLLLRGYTYEEMGKMLYINDKTVASHVQSLKQKLGVSKRHEIFSYANRKGFMAMAYNIAGVEIKH